MGFLWVFWIGWVYLDGSGWGDDYFGGWWAVVQEGGVGEGFWWWLGWWGRRGRGEGWGGWEGGGVIGRGGDREVVC